MAEEGGNKNENTQIIRGIPFPKSQRFIKKNIVDAMDHVPRDGDIIIASYPKTGTTWLQYILLQILSKGENFPTMDVASQKIVPFLELSGVAVLEESAAKPRMYKHHIPYDLVQKNAKTKCLYIYRNPEDTVVSYYKFIQSFDGNQTIDFGVFFDRFMSGSVEFGSYFHHVMSFYEHRLDSNLLLVSYEKLHTNTKGEILRIARFLGEEHYSFLSEDDCVLNKIIDKTSFESMKETLQHLTVPEQGKAVENKVINFFRKGVVGDGKKMLSEAQKCRIKEAIENVMKGTSIAEEWLQQLI